MDATTGTPSSSGPAATSPDSTSPAATDDPAPPGTAAASTTGTGGTTDTGGTSSTDGTSSTGATTDTGGTEDSGRSGTGGSRGPMPPLTRRRIVPAAVVLLVAALGVGGFVLTTPDVQLGDGWGPVTGVRKVTEGFDAGKLFQTEELAGLYFTVRNEGRLPVTLTARRDPDQDTMMTPHVQVRFVPIRSEQESGGLPHWPRTPGATTSVRVGPGEQAYLVLRIAYPAHCLGTARDYLSAAVLSSVTVEAGSFGHSATVELPLRTPVYVPSRTGTCDPTTYPAFPAD